jgi:branched-chain amino acid transport system permease protein
LSNKRKFNPVDWFDDFIDFIKFYFEKIVDSVREAIADFLWRAAEITGMIIGKSITGFTDLFFDPKLVNNTPLRWLVRAVGLVLIVIFAIGLQIAIQILSLSATVLGLRRGKEYNWKENLLVWAPLVIAAFWLPRWMSAYNLNQMVFFFAYTIIILGLNILIGVAGQSSLGHSAFCLIGGYVAAILNKGDLLGFEVGVIPAALAGGVFAAFVGMPIGVPAVRVKGPYLALITLGLMVSVAPIVKSKYLVKYTLGADGIPLNSINPPKFLSSVDPGHWLYYCALLLFLAFLSSTYIIIYRSKIGRALLSIRDIEERSYVLGINVAAYKMIAFALSAFYAGVGGGLLVSMTSFISPESFELKDSLNYMVAAAIGGLGSILGSVIGGLFLALQPDITRALSQYVNHGTQLLWTIYGLLVIIMMIVAPKGIGGEIQHRLHSLFTHLPLRRHNRREFFPDYEYDEELLTSKIYLEVHGENATAMPASEPAQPQEGPPV